LITPTLRAIIADDEPLARTKLRVLLGAEPGIQVVAECRDGKQTSSAVSAHQPDLLFLDIQMPDSDGFQVVADLAVSCKPAVVFTTAYDQYAIRAFEAHALDYLLKPFTGKRLHDTIQRARTELLRIHDERLVRQFFGRLATGKAKDSDRRLVVKSAGKVVFLDPDEVDWIEAAANYVKLYVGKESYATREGIGRISESLDPERFVRVHRSIIINVSKLKELQPCDSGEYIAVLKNGKQLSCSRSYRDQLHHLIEKSVLSFPASRGDRGEVDSRASQATSLACSTEESQPFPAI
jgi:two-component system LytT family response regulator